MLYFVIIAGLVASFIDSVVGGGGLISLPALLLTGIPLSIALGTNKMASSMSTLTSTISFFKSGKMNFALIKYLFPLSFIGAALGSYTVIQMPAQFLKPLVIVMLIGVTIYTMVRKDWGKLSTYRGLPSKSTLYSGIFAFTIGFYDGFFGPGTGTFLIFAFLMLGFDFVTAAGNAKALNFASNIASFVTFIVMGSVHLQYGLIMGLAMIVGALIGSKVAIQYGATYIRPLFIAVTVALISKQIWDYVL